MSLLSNKGLDTKVLDGGGGGGGAAISVQQGTFTCSATSTDITISAVDTANSIIIIQRVTATAYPPVNDLKLRPEFVNSTTIRFTKYVEYSYSTQYTWKVIEFSGVKSIQSGLATSQYPSITTVDPNKSMVFGNSKSNSGDTTTRYMSDSIALYSTYLKVDLGYPYQDYFWAVVEFN